MSASHSPDRLRRYSVHFLMVAGVLVAICVLFLTQRYNRVARHNAAIEAIQNSGAAMFVVDADGNYDSTSDLTTDFFSQLSGKPLLYAAHIVLDRDASAEYVRSLIPRFRDLIPLDEMNLPGENTIEIFIDQGSAISDQFATELQSHLPAIRVSRLISSGSRGMYTSKLIAQTKSK